MAATNHGNIPYPTGHPYYGNLNGRSVSSSYVTGVTYTPSTFTKDLFYFLGSGATALPTETSSGIARWTSKGYRVHVFAYHGMPNTSTTPFSISYMTSADYCAGDEDTTGISLPMEVFIEFIAKKYTLKPTILFGHSQGAVSLLNILAYPKLYTRAATVLEPVIKGVITSGYTALRMSKGKYVDVNSAFANAITTVGALRTDYPILMATGLSDDYNSASTVSMFLASNPSPNLYTTMVTGSHSIMYTSSTSTWVINQADRMVSGLSLQTTTGVRLKPNSELLD